MSRSFPDVPSMLESLNPSYPVFCLYPEVFARATREFVEGFPGRQALCRRRFAD